MSIVSGADHWMFISSTGALTAGRRNADLALFPYYTDDKIHDSAEITGSKTLIVVEKQGRSHLWEPFSDRYRGVYRLQRNLYKSFWGNKLIFEESNADLGLTFRYGWFNSDRFGWIRRAWLINRGRRPRGSSCWTAFKISCPAASAANSSSNTARCSTPTRKANWSPKPAWEYSGSAPFRLIVRNPPRRSGPTPSGLWGWATASN